jgi:hypothetical protein
MAATESLLASEQQERKAQNQTRAQALAALAAARRELATIAPETQWAEPPSSLPDWHSDSPYCWVTKETLRLLRYGQDPLKSFTKDGSLTSEMASILAIDEQTRHKLNEQIARAVAEFQALQAAKVRLSDDPSRVRQFYEDVARHEAGRASELARYQAESRAMFPWLVANDSPPPLQTLEPGGVDEPVLTVVVPRLPEQDGNLFAQIGQLLEQNLGPERSGIITDFGGDWLNSWAVNDRFVMTGVVEGGQITVSVMRHADGKYMVVGPIGGFEDGIPASDVPQHIPGYLLPFFANILNPPAAGSSVGEP